MTACRTRRAMHRLLACSTFVGALACGSDPGGPAAPPDVAPPASGPQPLLVSNPVGDGRAAYVALPSLSIPPGARATLRHARSGRAVEVAVPLGGFDPVALEVAVDDTVTLRVDAGPAAIVEYMAKVPPRRRPTVVRASPGPGRSDVPLNARVELVFSEPLAPASVVAGSVQILRAGAPITGTLALADAARLTVVFTPDAELDAGATYHVVVTERLQDTDGDPVLPPAPLAFTTEGVPGPFGPPPSCCTTLDDVFERREPSSWSSFDYTLVLHADGLFSLTTGHVDSSSAFTWDGFQQRTGDSFALMFRANIGHPMGPWEAAGTVVGDAMSLRFNTHASLSDFEDGEFLRRAAPLGQRGTLRARLETSGEGTPASVHAVLTGDGIRSARTGEATSGSMTLFAGAGDVPLATGTYTLAVEAPANCAAPAPVTFTIAPGAVTDVAFALPCTAFARVTGTLVITGTQPWYGNGSGFLSACDARGRCLSFWVANGLPSTFRLAPGRWDVRFVAFGCGFGTQLSLMLQPGEDREIAGTAACPR